MKRAMIAMSSMLAVAVSAFAADAEGKWTMKMDFQGNQIDSVMTVTKGADGAYKATWSGRRGEDELRNFKVDGDTVTFERTISAQGQEFDLTFTGTIDGNSIVGTFDTAMGAMDVTGAREAGAVPAAGGLEGLLGDWDAHVSSALGAFDNKMTFKGDGTGVYHADGGVEYDLTNVTLDGDKVTFNMTLDLDGQALPLTFEGTLDGANLTGEFISDLGNGQVTATKAGALPVFAGTWDITSESALGTLERVLVVNGDLSGWYKTGSDDFALSNVKIDGNVVSFNVTVDVQGQDLPLTFNGTVDGSKLTGEFSSEAGGATVTGMKRAGDGADLVEITQAIGQVLDLLKAQDVEAMIAHYTDDFQSSDGMDKGMLKEFLVGAKEQGFLEGMEVHMGSVEISREGAKAKVEGIELEGAFGFLTLNLELEQRAGRWMVTRQESY